ncbi:MAG TPA: D-hexose-6-phosphate mutarotase [Gammaproteobacteria bacterium]|nr:D-hexose-6-phosphate mutarotase [Gammaproteobacteria bacterium]
MQLDSLNARFAIDNHLVFVTGQGGLTNAVISNDLARATVSLYAGQVLSWQPKAMQHDVLFLSDRAYYQAGKAIKGGVPVCWPWFGPDPQGKGRPAHGFARTSAWKVLDTAALENGATQLVLGLTLNDQTRSLWEGDIEAQLEITVGNTLRLALTTHNRGNEPIELGQALHTYFAVGDIAKTMVSGLEDRTYIDKVDNSRQKVQMGAVTVSGEVDRIYTGVDRELQIHDAAHNRVIHIQAGGSASAVVWNPWQAIAASMADLGDEDYRHMLCVETTNAGPDVVKLAAGAKHTLSAEYTAAAI